MRTVNKQHDPSPCKQTLDLDKLQVLLHQSLLSTPFFCTIIGEHTILLHQSLVSTLFS